MEAMIMIPFMHSSKELFACKASEANVAKLEGTYPGISFKKTKKEYTTLTSFRQTNFTKVGSVSKRMELRVGTEI